jgi:hypothetical protein
MSAALDELFAELEEPVDIVDNLGDVGNCPQPKMLAPAWVHHGGRRTDVSSIRQLK